ncbi:MAG: glutamine amidotransferase family protein [Lamprobacter sp.]|uniref:class II glutamine amidotransferase n=1 Tax=Lamprobacter sp. TaxID=3100796 RepID=UPI002B259E88|nr:glutamine amidotransferase family protein [Lamprobacter sp.]MEA3642397.1 glutamine amidotransferase family protein [Lamprobacter sp.]
MCGIVGLYLKDPALEPRLGELFAPMLAAMSDRGPDSAGFAIYGDEVGPGRIKLTLQHEDPAFDWSAVASALAARSGNTAGSEPDWFQNATAAVFKLATSEGEARAAFSELAPDARIMSVGRSIEILKGVGRPQAIIDRFNLPAMQGTHIIGHTRMATESAVSMAGSHPFSTGQDLCLVHNGSLSNHNWLRKRLEKQGIRFETENDSEVAAGYLTWRLRTGDSLEQALHKGLEDLDGFFTLTIGTRDGFAVIRDPVACKPAVLAETDQYVAMASEYRALVHLPGIEQASVWEPDPARVYLWERTQALGAAA